MGIGLSTVQRMAAASSSTSVLRMATGMPAAHSGEHNAGVRTDTPALALYDWAPSPFCIKVRAMLDYKGLSYRRIAAFGPALFDLHRRGRIGKVPALDIDGRLVTDSTDIAHELERIAPQPALLPRGARERALCHALEDWCDEALYFIGLHYQWVDAQGAPMVPLAFGTGPVGALAYRFYRRRIVQQLRGQGTGRKPPERIADDLARELETIDALLSDAPFLLGDAPLLCDFALFGQLVYWTRPPQTARAIGQHARLLHYLERMKALRAGKRG